MHQPQKKLWHRLHNEVKNIKTGDEKKCFTCAASYPLLVRAKGTIINDRLAGDAICA